MAPRSVSHLSYRFTADGHTQQLAGWLGCSCVSKIDAAFERVNDYVCVRADSLRGNVKVLQVGVVEK